VMTNMAFNLGVHGLLGFHHALSAVQTGNYAAAAIAMAASTWYTQVGARAHRLCVQMSTGVWV
jgi:lysozyme